MMSLRYDIDRLDNRDPVFVEDTIAAIEPALGAWFDPVVRGMDHIPEGAALYVGNHNGGLLSADTFIFGAAAFRARGIDAVPYGLGHEVAISVPGIHQVLVPLGAVRASHDNARLLLAEGAKVLVYPGGDLDAMRPYAKRDRIVFGKRRGYIRLALRARVPIVPVVAAGAHETFFVLTDGRRLARALGLHRVLRLDVWPITLSVPWGLVVGITPPYFPMPTKIFIEVMEPIRFDREGDEAADDAAYVEECHARVHAAMEQTLERLATERRATPPRRVRDTVRALLLGG
jgi:1-acyl-sn-glycerol-3-phosphate acyltransferase